MATATGRPATAEAQQRSTDIPAEFPPSSYEGRQYVDSRGCVYVRAGVEGAVTWVPRVSRSRQQVCNAQPTFAGGRPATQTARSAAPVSPNVVQITPDVAPAPAAAPVRTAAPAPTRVTRPAPQPQRTVVRAAPKPAPTPAPRVVRAAPAPVVAAPQVRVVRQAPKPVPAPRAIAVPETSSVCKNRSAVAQQYTGRGGYPVRCGPQTTPHVTVIRRGDAPTSGSNVYRLKPYDDSSLQGQPRIVPRHVYAARQTQPTVVPHGYKPAWDDDRLNRNRAYQTVAGYYATQEIWTNTVPRQLRATAKRPGPIKDPILFYR